MEERPIKRGRVPKDLNYNFSHIIPQGFEYIVKNYQDTWDQSKYKKNILPVFNLLYDFFDEKRGKSLKSMQKFNANFIYSRLEFIGILKEFLEEYIEYEEISFYYYLKQKFDVMFEIRDSRRYFTDQEEAAVKLYKETPDPNRANLIYNKFLQYPFEKLVENIINTYKYTSEEYTFSELQSNTVAFLHEKLHRFDVNRGAKAYSYLGTIAKHKLLGDRKKEREKKLKVSAYEDIYSSIVENIDYSYNITPYETNFMMIFFYEIPSLLENHMNSDNTLTDRQKTIGECLIKIIKEWKFIAGESDKINKNIIFDSIRNMTGYDTNEIRIAIKIFKQVYYDAKKDRVDEEYNPLELI